MDTLLLHDVVTPELGFVLAVHALAAVGADAARALAAGPQLVLEVALLHGALGLQLLSAQVRKAVPLLVCIVLTRLYFERLHHHKFRRQFGDVVF